MHIPYDDPVPVDISNRLMNTRMKWINCRKNKIRQLKKAMNKLRQKLTYKFAEPFDSLLFFFSPAPGGIKTEK